MTISSRNGTSFGLYSVLQSKEECQKNLGLLNGGDTAFECDDAITWGAGTPDDLELFANPVGVAVGVGTRNGTNVYVTDTEKRKLWKFDDSGDMHELMDSTYLDEGGGGVAVDASGNAFVADAAGNVLKYNATSGDVSTVIDSTYLSGSAKGVAVDLSGNVYVVDQYTSYERDEDACQGSILVYNTTTGDVSTVHVSDGFRSGVVA